MESVTAAIESAVGIEESFHWLFLRMDVDISRLLARALAEQKPLRLFDYVLLVCVSHHTPKASFFFHISSGRLRADRCLPGEIGAPEVCPSGGLLYFLSIPSSARTASENLRLRSLFATQ